MTFRKSLLAVEYWVLVIAAVGAIAGLSWFVVMPLTLAALSLTSLPKYLELWPRAKAAGAEREWWKTIGLSIINSLGAVAAAYLLGVLIRLLW